MLKDKLFIRPLILCVGLSLLAALLFILNRMDSADPDLWFAGLLVFPFVLVPSTILGLAAGVLGRRSGSLSRGYHFAVLGAVISIPLGLGLLLVSIVRFMENIL